MDFVAVFFMILILVMLMGININAWDMGVKLVFTFVFFSGIKESTIFCLNTPTRKINF
jgi:hypothetical protein